MNTVLVVLVVLGVGLAMLGWEWGHAGPRFSAVKGWWWRAAFLNGIQALVSWIAAVTWNRWLPNVALWHLGGHGLFADTLLGYGTITFVYYWWHRARHEVPFLWRWFHQIHHSASRLEVLTSFYKHPVEILTNGMLSSLIVYVLLGLDATSAGITFAVSGLGELIYHWNVKTPHWLGYFFQRPESHRVHHQLGHHTNNFSDLPLWDLLFGTFENPRIAPAECGFGPGVEQHLRELLLGADVEVLSSHAPSSGGTP